MNNQKETTEVIWKAIPGHPFFEVSNMGVIRRLEHDLEVHAKGTTWIAHYKAKDQVKVYHYGGKDNRYLSVRLDNETVRLHILVATLFVENPDPQTKTTVDHIDNNPENCRADNLRWLTPQENSMANRKKTEHSAEFYRNHPNYFQLQRRRGKEII